MKLITFRSNKNTMVVTITGSTITIEKYTNTKKIKFDIRFFKLIIFISMVKILKEFF